MEVKSLTTRPDLESPFFSVEFGFNDQLADLFHPFREFSTRDLRKEEAEFFIDGFADYPVIRAYSCARDERQRLWSDKWLGITWVALQGRDSMCIVVREDDLLNLKRKLCPGDICTPSYFYRRFWNAIKSNIEDIEDFNLQGGNCMIPFSVVTVCPGMGPEKNGGQGSGAEYSARQTSKFLHDEMKSGATFTLEKTVQTAISALEHLFCQEFKADEIRVYVWNNGEIVGWEMPKVRKIPDLEELLATLRGKNDDLLTHQLLAEGSS